MDTHASNLGEGRVPVLGVTGRNLPDPTSDGPPVDGGSDGGGSCTVGGGVGGSVCTGGGGGGSVCTGGGGGGGGAVCAAGGSGGAWHSNVPSIRVNQRLE